MKTLFATVGAFCLFPFLAAADEGKYVRVGCPPVWPRPGHAGERLSYSNDWTDLSYATMEADADPVIYQDRETELDCAYGARKHNSTLRLTLIVPGQPVRCQPAPGKAFLKSCLVPPGPDGTVAPPQIWLAERLSYRTTLLGFGLRRSWAELAELATASSFACMDVREAVIRCARGRDAITVTFTDSLSSMVEWTVTGEDGQTQDETIAMYRTTVLRFGLSGEGSGTDLDAIAWGSDWRMPPDDPVTVTLHQTRPARVTLRDMAAGKR